MGHHDSGGVGRESVACTRKGRVVKLRVHRSREMVPVRNSLSSAVVTLSGLGHFARAELALMYVTAPVSQTPVDDPRCVRQTVSQIFADQSCSYTKQTI